MLVFTAKECNSRPHNIHSSESLKFIRDNLCNESAIFADYNFKTEDAEAYYITLIKYLLRNVEPSTFYNASKKAFPILKPLLKYSHHSDVMIKNAARISLMNVFQKCQGQAMEHINSVTIPLHVSDILLHLKQIALDMQHFYNRFNVTMEKMHLCYTEELEYLDDVLKRLNPTIQKSTILILINDFIVSFIFPAIIYEKQQTDHTSLISCTVGLYLLSNLLQTITDITMKDYVSELILQESEIQMCKNIQQRNMIQIIKSLQFILLKSKTDIDTLYTLHILYSIQAHTLKSSENMINFYDKFLYTLMKSMFNYQFDSPMECLKLKLLVSLFKPLTQRTVTDDARWLKLHNFFSQALEVLYSDIFMLIQQKIIPIMDEEYDIFMNMKHDINKTLDDVNYLIKGDIKLSKAVNGKQIALHYFFYARSLYLATQNKKETVLPLLKSKIKIGEIMYFDIDSYIHCEKLTHDNFYDSRHFLKLTDKQLLILQRRGNEGEGIVIFNSYYKDIILSICTNNIVKIHEVLNSTENCFKNTSKSLCIQLKFYSCEDLYFLTDILWKAKFNQVKIVMKKCLKLKL